MSYVTIWVHAVWGTKRRRAFLEKEIKTKVIDHIKANARVKKIHIDCIDGVSNHLHCLISLNADMSIAKVMQLIKGESSFWINKDKITRSKFEWADEYYAASVCESSLSTVREYIRNQESHHHKPTFGEKYDEFIKMLDDLYPELPGNSQEEG